MPMRRSQVASKVSERVRTRAPRLFLCCDVLYLTLVYSFFSSYNLASTGWTYIMGNFAQQSLPLNDSVTLTIIRNGHILSEVVTVSLVLLTLTIILNRIHLFIQLPYRARIDSTTVNFTDTASWRANNCVAIDGTNGVNLYATTSNSPATNSPLIKFQQQPPVPAEIARKQPLNVMLDTSPPSDIVLPPPLQPALPAVNGSRSVSQFYLLKDGKTGVMALGSFSDTVLSTFLLGMLQGLQSLQALGATQLIVDVVSIPQIRLNKQLISQLYIVE